MAAPQTDDSRAAHPLHFDGQVLDSMYSEIAQAREVFRPSRFWDELGNQGVEQLTGHGLNNFKRTVNLRYFNWGIFGILAHQFLPMLRYWLLHPSLQVFRTGLRTAEPVADGGALSGLGSGYLSAKIYRLFVSLLHHYVKHMDRDGLLETLEESEIGNPYVMTAGSRRISQDLCNSVHEFYSITTGLDPREGFGQVAEIGAGYGRLASVFLGAVPKCTYTIIDIPPALYIAQEYLSALFPAERVFRFRPFANYEDVRDEVEAARIRFFTANQIEKLPADTFQIMINISSFHEMTREQIDLYFREIDRLCRGRLYTKQWKKSITRVNGFTIAEREYPLPETWRTVFQRRHPIQRWFFEALYETR